MPFLFLEQPDILAQPDVAEQVQLAQLAVVGRDLKASKARLAKWDQLLPPLALQARWVLSVQRQL